VRRVKGDPVKRGFIGLVAILVLAAGTLAADHLLRKSPGVSGQTGHVVINEVEHNPPGEDVGNEWVELYNPTKEVVVLDGWTLSTTSGRPVKLTLSGIVPTGGYLVITYGARWLADENEQVVLKDSGGIEVDSSPSQLDPDDDDRCWARYPNGGPNWLFGLNTKGAPNGDEPVPEGFMIGLICLMSWLIGSKYCCRGNVEY
jgi:hypothetical protein